LQQHFAAADAERRKWQLAEPLWSAEERQKKRKPRRMGPRKARRGTWLRHHGISQMLSTLSGVSTRACVNLSLCSSGLVTPNVIYKRR
jgi:hypothetical protein